MRISELTTHRRPDETADAAFLRMLQQRLEEVKQDYLFDAREAESAYLTERKKADQLALQARLRGDVVDTPPVKLKTPPRKRSPARPAEPAIPTGDVFDQDSDDEGTGGMFELLEEMPQTETTADGVVVQVRDLSVPKNWSGRTPRTLLLEVVQKTDKFAHVSFRSISGASRAKRAAVRITWQHGNLSEWAMEDVGCHDAGQAEHYVATVALHAITFPATQGFAVGGTASGNNATSTSFRLLPPVYRDLWNELEEKRRAEHDRINREIWAKLRSILEPKLKGSKVPHFTAVLAVRLPLAQTPVRRSQGATPTVQSNSEREYGQDLPTSADIAAGWQARQESYAYQEMLVWARFHRGYSD